MINELKDIAPGDMKEKLAARVFALLPQNSFIFFFLLFCLLFIFCFCFEVLLLVTCPYRFINNIPFAAQQAVINELKDIAPGDMKEKLAARVFALLPQNSFIFFFLLFCLLFIFCFCFEVLLLVTCPYRFIRFAN